MELPKVNIALAGSAVIAICSTLGGGVWYMSQQASVIEALQSDLEKLTVANSAVDRTNLLRDVQQNTENIDELLDIIIEMEETGEETAEDVYSEIDLVWEEFDNVVGYFNELVKLQARISILEKTVEFTRQDGM
tara:strand:+ start:622 stop:1023 length:402 start_codon:yes stop_codon:yes gene_type:complete